MFKLGQENFKNSRKGNWKIGKKEKEEEKRERRFFHISLYYLSTLYLLWWKKEMFKTSQCGSHFLRIFSVSGVIVCLILFVLLLLSFSK